MKKLSLRWRLTLLTISVLALICAFSTAYSMLSADRMMTPVATSIAGISVTAQNFNDTVVSYAGEYYPAEYIISSAEAQQPFFWYTAVSDYQTTNRTLKPRIAHNGYASLDTPIYFQVAEISSALSTGVQETTYTISAVQEGFNYSSLVFMLIMIALGGILVYLVSGYALKPVSALSADIKAIDGDKLSRRVEIGTGGREMCYLADSFNGMLERLEQSFEAQKRFSTAAAHELKTPLSVIRTNVDVFRLSSEPTHEEYNELLDVLTRQTGRMNQLVDDLFTMSSLGECDISEEIELESVLNAVINDLSQSAAEKEITINLDAENCTVKGNQVMLSRAISNLVENAIRYTPERGQAYIVCRAEEENSIITVSDTGSGIAEEHLKLIFDPFYRVDPSRSRNFGGAGIGLAIASEIAVQHGGKITASNSQNGGAVFTLTLPRLGQ